MDFRVLGRCQGERGGLLARAARLGRIGSQCRRAFGGQHLAARLLDMAAEPLCLASRFLGGGASGLDLGSCPLRLGPARLCVCQRLLGLLPQSSRRAVCAGVFRGGIRLQRDFSYSPTTAIDLGLLVSHLFVRPQYQDYYFGDYYAADYQTAGFYPAYSYNSGRIGYDPIYAHERWQHRQDNGWERRQEADFANRRNHDDFRPARTWTDQRRIDLHNAQARQRGLALGTPLDELRRNQNNRLRFQPVDQAERQRLAQQGQEVQRFRQERQRLESNTAAGPTGTRQ